MPCETAIITEVHTVKPDISVEEALAFIHEKNVRAMPVVDHDGKLVGMFSLEALLKSLLPVAVTMEEGLQKLGFVIGAGPGIAKRLKKAQTKTVADVMLQDIIVAHTSTALWEAIRLMVKYGSPIPVVEEDSGKLIGIISEQSAMTDLEELLKEMEANGEA